MLYIISRLWTIFVFPAYQSQFSVVECVISQSIVPGLHGTARKIGSRCVFPWKDVRFDFIVAPSILKVR